MAHVLEVRCGTLTASCRPQFISRCPSTRLSFHACALWHACSEWRDLQWRHTQRGGERIQCTAQAAHARTAAIITIHTTMHTQLLNDPPACPPTHHVHAGMTSGGLGGRDGGSKILGGLGATLWEPLGENFEPHVAEDRVQQMLDEVSDRLMPLHHHQPCPLRPHRHRHRRLSCAHRRLLRHASPLTILPLLRQLRSAPAFAHCASPLGSWCADGQHGTIETISSSSRVLVVDTALTRRGH